jgi:hypothetical protein
MQSEVCVKMVEDDMNRDPAINESEFIIKKNRFSLELCDRFVGLHILEMLSHTKPSDCTRSVCIVGKLCCLDMYSETVTKENIRRHTGSKQKKVHFENFMFNLLLI